jgi:peptidoglycan/LPS O-acetylase OafA/YrhL
VTQISRPRLHALDGLRGLAALAVVVLHVWMYTDANFPARGRTDLLDRSIGELRVAVELFFVLSGFLLAQPWLRGKPPSLGRYAVRRLARIAPAYWAAVIGTLLLLHGTGHGRDIDLNDLPKFLLFVANIFPETRNQLDPPMWSLHIEVSFYVVLPLIGIALMRAGKPLLVCGALIVASLAYSTLGVLNEWPPEATWTLPSYLDAFACGIAAAVIPHQHKRGLSPFIFGAGACLVLANAIWHSGGNSGELGKAVADLPASLGFGAIIWVLAARPGPVLASRPLRALGTLSFGVYLWHMPVLYGLQLHERFPERFVPAIAWVLPITFALATASWFLIEKPAIALSARALKRRATRARTVEATS